VEILVVAPYVPYPPWFGGAARVYHLLRVLARDHRVTLLCFAAPGDKESLPPLRAVCAEIHTVPHPGGARWRRLFQAVSLVGRPYYWYAYHSRRLDAALRRLLASRRFDLVQTEFAQMAYHGVPGGVPWVLDEHNVEYLLFERTLREERSLTRQLYALVQARKFRRDEVAACRRADAVLVTSETDGGLLGPETDGVPIRVVPNGVDTAYFTPGPGPGDGRRLLFTGAMNYAPNADGIARFCAEVLPRVQADAPGTTLTIVGREPPEAVRRLAGPLVRVTGTVPDVRPFMHEAGVFVVPLRVGSGTRLKILEALACGRAVVSTSLGCEGLAVTPGRDILVADTPATFAAAVLRCLRDPAARAELGRNGRALVERQYRWEAIGDDLTAFYRDLRPAARTRPVAAGWRPAPEAGVQ
jgi:sugar transferase (PEP-CTERM/EpsH1 system associated)